MGYHFPSRLTATLNLCLIYFKITWALAILLEHMQKKFEINQTKIKGSCQSRRKVVTHDSKSDLPLVYILLARWVISTCHFKPVKTTPWGTYSEIGYFLLGFHFSLFVINNLYNEFSWPPCLKSNLSTKWSSVSWCIYRMEK